MSCQGRFRGDWEGLETESISGCERAQVEKNLGARTKEEDELERKIAYDRVDK